MIRHLNARKLQNQKKVTDERTDGRMNKWTNGRTNIRINNLRWLQHKSIAKISSLIWLYFHSIKSPSHPPDIPENSFSWFVSVFGWGDPFTISPFFFCQGPIVIQWRFLFFSGLHCMYPKFCNPVKRISIFNLTHLSLTHFFQSNSLTIDYKKV